MVHRLGAVRAARELLELRAWQVRVAQEWLALVQLQRQVRRALKQARLLALVQQAHHPALAGAQRVGLVGLVVAQEVGRRFAQACLPA